MAISHESVAKDLEKMCGLANELVGVWVKCFREDPKNPARYNQAKRKRIVSYLAFVSACGIH